MVVALTNPEELFGSLKKSAEDAMRAANQDTADELTGRFQRHLMESGIPEKQAMKSSVKWDKDTHS